jgi:hypothetical protein
LYRASSFLGRLEPLATAPFAIDDVSFGPRFWLVRSRDGKRLAIDPKTGADVAIAPQGLLDIATAGDGRVVAVLELGRAVASTDGGATYRDVQGELGAVAVALVREPLGFALGEKQQVTLERDGTLTRLPPRRVEPDRGLRDRRFTSPLPTPDHERFAPLNQAVAKGVSGPPGHALVALEASVCEVDLISGQVIRQGPELLPDSPDCQLVRPSGELLMACQTRDALVILSKVDTPRPVVERSFPGRPVLHVTDRLLIERSCDAQPAPFSVCTRWASGAWKQLTLSKRPDAAGDKAAYDAAAVAGAVTPDPNPKAFAPRADGGAVAFVDSLFGYVDLATGQAVRLLGPTGNVMQDASNCWVDSAGALRCLTPTGAYAWDKAGNPEAQVFQFEWLQAAGARGLGKDRKGRLFQTEDYGKNWVEVAGPPGKAEGNNHRKSCSEVGCVFSGWLRTGWEPTPVEELAAPLLLETPERVAPPRPTLACSADQPAAPTFFQSPNSAEADAAEDPKRIVAGFGVDRLRAEHDRLPLETTSAALDGYSMHGLLSTFSRRVEDPRAPDAELYEREPLRFRYLDYFDTSARINSASVGLVELSKAATRLGALGPGTDFEGAGPLPIVPVLARGAGRTAGFVVSMENAHLWVNGGHALLLAPWQDASVASASLERDGSLVVLMTTQWEGPRVWRYRQGFGVELFGLPRTPLRPSHETPDALGISDQGELAVLRFPSSPDAPSADDPPLLYAPGKPLQSLAPWSSLKPATAPACADRTGYRAIVLPPRSWLEATYGGTEEPISQGMAAAVRWSKERVCLEAVEVPGTDLGRDGESLETRVLWNPAQRNAASRVGIGSGYELREPMHCLLGPPL